MHLMSQNCTTDFILSPKLDIITYNTELFAAHTHKNGDFDHKKYLKIPQDQAAGGKYCCF